MMIFDIQTESKQHMKIRRKSVRIMMFWSAPLCSSGAHLLVAAAASRGQGETLRGRVELHDEFGPHQEFQHVSTLF